MNKKELFNFIKNNPCKYLLNNKCELKIKCMCFICEKYEVKK